MCALVTGVQTCALPISFTSGCNAEAHAFAERVDDFAAAGATVIGMSADTVETLAKFSTQKCAGKFAVASAGPRVVAGYDVDIGKRSEEHTSELQSLMHISYAVFCLKKTNKIL